jgi:hypothetical protein
MTSNNDPKDPIAQRIKEARDKKLDEAHAAAGEREILINYQRQANENGKAQLSEIEERFSARCESINDAGQEPKFQYDNQRHRLTAGKFALNLELTEGFSPYRFDMTSTLDHDLHFGGDPDYEPTNWKFLARMDDEGFYWECNDQKYSNERIVTEGLEALAANIARQ